MSTVTTPNIDAGSLQQNGPRSTSTRKTAVFVGVLFLTATAAFIFAEAINSRLIPRWLAILGLVTYPTLLAGTVLDMFNVVDMTQGIGLVALVPGALFEIILPVWLIAKGFNVPDHD